MATDAAHMSGEKSGLQVQLEELVYDTVKLAVGLLAAGAVLFYVWNWALAPAFTFLRPLGGFWNGPLLAGGLYLGWMVWTAIRDDKLSVNLDSFDEAVGLMASPALVLALFWAVHHYLA